MNTIIEYLREFYNIEITLSSNGFAVRVDFDIQNDSTWNLLDLEIGKYELTITKKDYTSKILILEECIKEVREIEDRRLIITLDNNTIITLRPKNI